MFPQKEDTQVCGVPRAAWVKRGGVRGEVQCSGPVSARGRRRCGARGGGRRARRRRRHWTTIVWRRGPRSRRERDSGAAIKGEAKPYVERSRKPAWPEHWYEPRRVWVEWTRGTPQGVQQVDRKRWRLCGRRIAEGFETEATAEGHTGRRGEGAQEVVVCGWNPERTFQNDMIWDVQSAGASGSRGRERRAARGVPLLFPLSS